jgi:triphosphoribosyl-dephospho-CoA synthase
VTPARRLVAAPLPDWVACHVAKSAQAALLAELDTWPKPGLVSRIDQGSHDDMDAGTFEASATAIAPFFVLLAEAGATGADMPVLREIGVAAEQAMLAATGGVNTHRGAIFGLGLLCAAAGAEWSGHHASWRAHRLCDVVRLRWGGAILRGPIPLRSHGTDAWRRFGAGGARAQAATGFPHALECGLPSLRRIRALTPADPQAARVQAFFALMAEMEDTNLLHRGGAEGLVFAQQAASDFLDGGGVEQPGWKTRAADIHHAFVVRRLSPGGSADLLAISLFLDSLERDVPRMAP